MINLQKIKFKKSRKKNEKENEKKNLFNFFLTKKLIIDEKKEEYKRYEMNRIEKIFLISSQ